MPRRGGRPSREAASQLEDKILEVAAHLFFDAGYGAVSVEEIVQRAQISKRTFYARFPDKAAVFRAVVHRVIQRLRPDAAATERLFQGARGEEVLRRIAPIIARASLAPQALALQRVVVAEAKRFPELALILHEQGARQEAIQRIAGLLERIGHEEGRVSMDANFAAEQFMFMLTALPQRRALGFGTPMNERELGVWVTNTLDLFLQGCWRVVPEIKTADF